MYVQQPSGFQSTANESNQLNDLIGFAVALAALIVHSTLLPLGFAKFLTAP